MKNSSGVMAFPLHKTNNELTPHEIWKKDVNSLKRTLYRMKNLPPAMGSKWQRGMIRYYSDRLAELVINEPVEES